MSEETPSSVDFLGLKASREKLKVEGQETAELTRQAIDLGIDIPKGRSDWWWLDENSVGEKSLEDGTFIGDFYLTRRGKAGLKKLIRDEKRKNFKWWVEAVGSIVTLLVGLLGTLIGVLAFMKK